MVEDLLTRKGQKQNKKADMYPQEKGRNEISLETSTQEIGSQEKDGNKIKRHK